MEFSLLLGQQIVSLFLMGLVGFLVVRFRFLKTEDSRVLSTLIVYAFMPCVSIRAFQIELSAERVRGFVLSMVVSIFIHVAYMLIARIIRKPLHLTAIEETSIIFSNSANMIVPLVISVLGPEWVFYTSPYILVWNVLFWIYGNQLLDRTGKASFKKILINPNVIAMCIGILLFVFQIKLPYILSETVSSFASAIGPTSMLVVGMLMGSVGLKKMFSKKRIYMVSFFRLVALPLVVLAFLYIANVGQMMEGAKEIILVVLLQAAAPVGVVITQMAQIYNDDAQYSSAVNVTSVFFCIVTMPLIILLYNFII